MKNSSLFLALCMVIFASCEEERVADSSSFQTVTLTAVVRSATAQTRINSTEKGDQFTTGDVIAVSNGEGFIDYVYEGSAWRPVTTGKYLVWKDPVMTFSAYHPSTEGTSMSSFTLPTDQSSPSKLSDAEYLLSESAEFSSDSPITLKLQRKMARMIINIVFAGGSEDDKTIHHLEIMSPASRISNSTPQMPTATVTPYKAENNKFYAILIPTGQAVNDVFVRMTTESNIEYILNGIPAMQPGKSYTYNVTARNTSPYELKLESVAVDEWQEGVISGGIRRRKVQFTATDEVAYYAEGDSVPITAEFKEYKKFSQWNSTVATRAAGDLKIDNPKSVSTFFIMPNQDVELTAAYTDAPYRLVIKKPGTILEGTEVAHPALVQETDTAFMRYYAQGDRADIYTPEDNHKEWRKSAETPSDIYTAMSYGGGYTKATTWFKISTYDVVLFPQYNVYYTPFWTTRKSNKGWLEANFIERINSVPNSVTIPGGGTFYRALTDEEKEVVMRALNEVENTFSIAPRRTISINFAVFNAPASGVGAATSPIGASAFYGYEGPKEYWLESDFDGRAAGRPAYSSTVEAVWRDQKNIDPGAAAKDNTSIGFRDGTIVVNHAGLSGWYKGEDPNRIPLGYIDAQSVIMHEIGHLVCYHSTNARVEEFAALDVFVAHVNDHSKNVLNGNMYSNDGGDAIIANDFVKSYLGYYLEVMSGSDNSYDFGHLLTAPGVGVGSAYRAGGSTKRQFADFELAFLQEMGWKINPAAWSQPQKPVLSKSLDDIQVSGDAGTCTVTVSNTGTGSMKWKIAKGAGWITNILPKSGVLVGGGSQTVTISYQALGSGQRSATITLSSSTPSIAAGNAIQDISITQKTK